MAIEGSIENTIKAESSLVEKASMGVVLAEVVKAFLVAETPLTVDTFKEELGKIKDRHVLDLALEEECDLLGIREPHRRLLVLHGLTDSLLLIDQIGGKQQND